MNYIRTIFLSISLLYGLGSMAVDTTFINTYGGLRYDNGSSVKSTSDGGIIMAGSTGSFGLGNADMYIVKVDSHANFLWSQSYGGLQTENCNSILETADNGFILVGYTNSFGSGQYDAYVVKTDSIGDTLWTKTFGGAAWDFAYDVIQTMDGNYIIVGETYSTTSGDNDVFIFKLDLSGNVLWTKSYGGAQQDFGRAIIELYDSSLVVAGGTSSFGAGALDLLILKLSSQGDSLWARAYGGTEDDWARDVIMTTDTGLSAVGTTMSFSADYKEMYHIKYNTTGDTLDFEENWGQNHDQEGYELFENNNVRYFLFGYSANTGAGGKDFILQVCNDAGSFLTGTTYGYSGDDEGFSFDRTLDNGLVLFGTTNSNGVGLTDFLLYKTDSVGRDYAGNQFTPVMPVTVYEDTSIEETPLAIYENFEEENLNVYPVPITDVAIIDVGNLYNGIDKLTFVLINNMGQVVIDEPINGSTYTFSRAGLADGLYSFLVLQRTDDELKRHSGKLMIIGK